MVSDRKGSELSLPRESNRTLVSIRSAATEIGSDGMARAWDKPGLGLELDWTWIDDHTIGVEE